MTACSASNGSSWCDSAIDATMSCTGVRPSHRSNTSIPKASNSIVRSIRSGMRSNQRRNPVVRWTVVIRWPPLSSSTRRRISVATGRAARASSREKEVGVVFSVRRSLGGNRFHGNRTSERYFEAETTCDIGGRRLARCTRKFPAIASPRHAIYHCCFSLPVHPAQYFANDPRHATLFYNGVHDDKPLVCLVVDRQAPLFH